MSKILTLGKNFFANEKRAYSNWKEAILKEIMQNGIDSPGCTRMDFDFIKGENTTKIIAKDNGAGMLLDVLENVFLVLGESKKEGNNPIGGFGVARQLITFANDSYVIKSFDYICRGSGAMYDIEKTKEFTRGCIFEIETDHHEWEDELKGLLNKSSVNASIYINGVKYNNSLHRGRKVRNLSFGEVFVNKSAKPGLYVRVNGLLMFSRGVNCSAQVCVEINPGQSKQVLTSNRYGLQHKESAEVDAFLNELAADTKSALKDKTKHFKKILNHGKCFSSKPKEKNVLLMSNGFTAVQKQEIESQASKHNYNYNSVNPSDESAMGNFSDFCEILQSMMILNECESVETVKLINNFYHPTQFKKSTSTRYQLLKEWFAVCKIVADEFSQFFNKEIKYSVGWVFSEGEDRCEAKCVTENEINYILINPINEDRKLKYSVNDSKDWLALITLAVHEFSHAMPVGESYHNEQFANIMTQMMIKVLGRMKEIFAAIKEIK